ncbi:hypothetical protein JCM3765_007567 [Sporobolomyces pararoseus]
MEEIDAELAQRFKRGIAWNTAEWKKFESIHEWSHDSLSSIIGVVTNRRKTEAESRQVSETLDRLPEQLKLRCFKVDLELFTKSFGTADALAPYHLTFAQSDQVYQITAVLVKILSNLPSAANCARIQRTLKFVTDVILYSAVDSLGTKRIARIWQRLQVRSSVVWVTVLASFTILKPQTLNSAGMVTSERI